MLIKKIKQIEPKPSRCISVDSVDKLFAVGDSEILTHNSVCQQNIIFSCLMRPEHWVILGIDLKQVELTRFTDFGMEVAVELGPAVDFLRFAQAVMMKRYKRMREMRVNNFQDLPVPGQALLVMIDEAGELLSPTGAKALADWTPVPTPSGMSTLKELKQGDLVLDNYGKPTKIINKYEPTNQDRFKVSISKDNTNQKESFVSGAEHLWTVAYFDNDKITKEETVDTKTLYEFIENEKCKPENKRLQVKIKRYIEE